MITTWSCLMGKLPATSHSPFHSSVLKISTWNPLERCLSAPILFTTMRKASASVEERTGQRGGTTLAITQAKLKWPLPLSFLLFWERWWNELYGAERDFIQILAYSCSTWEIRKILKSFSNPRGAGERNNKKGGGNNTKYGDYSPEPWQIGHSLAEKNMNGNYYGWYEAAEEFPLPPPLSEMRPKWHLSKSLKCLQADPAERRTRLSLSLPCQPPNPKPEWQGRSNSWSGIWSTNGDKTEESSQFFSLTVESRKQH